MSNLIVHSNIPCRAKDPETCRFHSAERRMNDAVERNDLDGYFRFRAQWEAAKAEDEVQLYLATRPPVREAERYRVDTKEIMNLIRYRHGDAVFDVQQPDGDWGYETFDYVDTVSVKPGIQQLIVRRESDGKLFGLEHAPYGGFDQNGDEEDVFLTMRPELVEVAPEDTVRLVTVYAPVSQPTVEEV